MNLRMGMVAGLGVFMLAACSKMESAKLSSSSALSSDEVRIDDMILRVKKASGGGGHQKADGFSVYSSEPWPKGIIPVTFAPGVSPQEQDMFFRACRNWGPAGISCVAYTDEVSRVHVTKDLDGCYSSVGYNAQIKTRVFNLAPTCWIEHIVTHELGHQIGLMHEHQRPDRDQYIEVLNQNVVSGKTGALTIIGAISLMVPMISTRS
ncbi:MAG: M57 family metalloprotease, partial [Pseudobdellovibrionaceae bacterium]